MHILEGSVHGRHESFLWETTEFVEVGVVEPRDGKFRVPPYPGSWAQDLGLKVHKYLQGKKVVVINFLKEGKSSKMW